VLAQLAVSKEEVELRQHGAWRRGGGGEAVVAVVQECRAVCV
jgi:hypothetical protein